MALYRHPRQNALKVGQTAAGAKLYFYAPGTTTAKGIYDASGNALANPVVADANGIFAAIYGFGSYKVVMTDSSDTTLWTQDNYFLDDSQSSQINAILYTDGASSSLAATSTGAASGEVVQTTYYDSTKTQNSGALFQFTGTTTLAKAGNCPDADGYFYDSVGKQFENVSDVKFIEHWGAYPSASQVSISSFLQAATTYMHTIGGGKLYAGTGVFWVDTTYLLRNNVTLIGQGVNATGSTRNTVIKLMDNSDCDVVRPYAASWPPTGLGDFFGGGGLRDISIDGNYSGQTGANDPVTGDIPHGININQALNHTIFDNVTSDQCIGNGWNVSSVTSTAVLPFTANLTTANGNRQYGYYIGSFAVGVNWFNPYGDANQWGLFGFGQLSATDSNLCFYGAFGENNHNAIVFEGGGAGSAGSKVQFVNPFFKGILMTGGAMTSGSPNLSVTNPQTYTYRSFNSDDVGNYVAVPGAGSGGGTLRAKISTVTDSYNVVLDTNASTTVSGQTISLGSTIVYNDDGASESTPRLQIQNLGASQDFAYALDDQINSIQKTWDQNDWLLYLEKGGIYIEDWHVVGASGEPAFTNSWANFGNPNQAPRFRIDQFGTVEIQGHVQSGSSGTSIFTLPAAYRPPANGNLGFVTTDLSTRTIGLLQVKSDGTVVFTGSAVTGVCLNVRFSVRS